MENNGGFVEQLDKILDGIASIRETQASMSATQQAMHEDIGNVEGHLKTLNGRVYGLEQNKADRKELVELRGRVWKIVLLLLGGGTVAGISVKELFF